MYMIVTGNLPFVGKNRHQVKESIINDDYKKPTGCSNECADLIKNLLEKNVSKRFSAEEALKHPWFDLEKDGKEMAKISEETLKSMKDYKGQTRLRKAAMTLLVKMTDDKEVADLRKEFERIDTDKSGFIDAAELRKAVQAS